MKSVKQLGIKYTDKNEIIDSSIVNVNAKAQNIFIASIYDIDGAPYY